MISPGWIGRWMDVSARESVTQSAFDKSTLTWQPTNMVSDSLNNRESAGYTSNPLSVPDD